MDTLEVFWDSGQYFCFKYCNSVSRMLIISILLLKISNSIHNTEYQFTTILTKTFVKIVNPLVLYRRWPNIILTHKNSQLHILNFFFLSLKYWSGFPILQETQENSVIEQITGYNWKNHKKYRNILEFPCYFFLTAGLL